MKSLLFNTYLGLGLQTVVNLALYFSLVTLSIQILFSWTSFLTFSSFFSAILTNQIRRFNSCAERYFERYHGNITLT